MTYYDSYGTETAKACAEQYPAYIICTGGGTAWIIRKNASFYALPGS
jgi:hypothetical protein